MNIMPPKCTLKEWLKAQIFLYIYYHNKKIANIEEAQIILEIETGQKPRCSID